MDFEENDAGLIAFALNIRKNMIETGDPILSAADAKEQDRHEIVRALDLSAMKKLIRIEELIQACYAGKIKIER